ncbi:hypothetical protein HG536_0C02830 [Torulaspora globosa]|uniref:RFX-type winged-helix domain-containing protein n=1 Tax=Torulaspora globosa TaxID=48254 RepID=A0A7G3ZF28_9SACH|nr:uncharacterized protein HG536_0C02830 [Torulaspora globosa]QLL32114.1 hypothetical protein HG536_0C02830 [Torulaspora globosa]
MNLYSNSGSSQSSPPPSVSSSATATTTNQTPRTGQLANSSSASHPGLVLQSPLSPANNNNNSNNNNGGGVQFHGQAPCATVFKMQPRPNFALPQPQQYQNYLPSPHRNIANPGAYSYHDNAQKAAVDNYYHRTYDDLRNRRLTTGYEEQARKYPKLTSDQQWPWPPAVPAQPGPVVMQTIPSIGTPLSSSGSSSSGNGGNGGGSGERKGFKSSGSTEAAGTGPCPLRKNTQETVAKSIAERFRDRPIAEYATIVRQAEIAVLNMDSQNHSKTAIQSAEQSRERERQVYALLWLMKNCVSENDSYVPRGRIFAQYAASCAQNSLKPLSQASLGKLIRSVFPHLTTRRLGMRGQSRYHYCGLRLVSDDSSAEPVSSGSQSSADKSLLLPSVAMGGTQSPSYDNEGNSAGGRLSGPEASFASKSPLPEMLKLEPSPVSLGQYSNDYDMIFLEDLYKKAFDNEIPIPTEYSLKFPSIPVDRLPAGTDPDIVSSLESLYHVHCNTIFEHVRFMKFDQLENVLMVFGSGSISPQMYNLFTSDELYDWIHDCDVITHVSLIKCLSRMLMDYENVSYETLTKLELFFKNYVSLTAKATMDLPVPMVNKKKELVEDFSRLVRRLVKCLKFIKQVAKLLPNFRDMKQDWVSYVNLDEVLDIVKRDGYNAVIDTIKDFMTIEVLDLLEELEAGHVYLDRFVKNYIEHIASIRNVPAYQIMDGITVFSRAFMADISLTLQQRGFPWYHLDMLSSLLVTYCFELNRFIT